MHRRNLPEWKPAPTERVSGQRITNIMSDDIEQNESEQKIESVEGETDTSYFYSHKDGHKHHPRKVLVNYLILGIFILLILLFVGTHMEGLRPLVTAVTPVENVMTEVVPETVNEAVFKTYRNEEYGFEFEYPSDWLRDDSGFEWRGALNGDLIHSVEFVDPDDEVIAMMYQCRNNRMLGWKSTEPTEEDCAESFNTLDKMQEDEINLFFDKAFARGSNNIFVRIHETELGLRDWLLSNYKRDNTELANYEIGRDVVLGGKSGYLSGTGCCGGVDTAYVVKNGGYVYEFGSNGRDGQVLELLNDSFRFIEDESNWKTYRDEEYGFEFEYPREITRYGAEVVNNDKVDVEWVEEINLVESQFEKILYEEGVSRKVTGFSLILEGYSENYNPGLSIIPNINKVTVEEERERLAKQIGEYGGVYDTSPIDGREAFDFQEEQSGRTIVVTKNYIYSFSLPKDVLETFKFVDKETEWQTYRNEEYDDEWEVHNGNVFIRGDEVVGADSDTFHSLGAGFFKDNDSIFGTGMGGSVTEFSNADYETFESLGFGYAKDSVALYYQNERVSDYVDLNTFKVTGYSTAEDKDYRYKGLLRCLLSDTDCQFLPN